MASGQVGPDIEFRVRKCMAMMQQLGRAVFNNPTLVQGATAMDTTVTCTWVVTALVEILCPRAGHVDPH